MIESKVRTDVRMLTWFTGVLAFVVLVWVAKSLSELILPVFVSFLIARLLRPYVTKLTKKGIPHAISILIVSVICALFAAGVGAVLGYCGVQVAEVIPGYAPAIADSIHGLQDLVAEFLRSIGGSSTTFAEPSKLLDAEKIIAMVTGALGSTMTALSTSFMIFILVLMILGAGDSFSNAVLAAYGRERHKKILAVVHETDEKMRRFLVSKSLVNLLSGVITAIIGLAFGLDLAIVFGVLTFFFTFVPVIGGIAALVLPMAFAYLQFGAGGMLIGIVIALLAGDMIIERVAEPRIMGKSMDLAPVVVILAFLFFTWLWGAVGAILAVPVMAMIKVLCESIPKLRHVAMLLQEH